MLNNEKSRGAPTPRPMLNGAFLTVVDSHSQPCSVEVAWHRYRRLVLQAAQNPCLLKDAWHRRSMARAHSAWRQLFVGATV